MSTSSSSSPIIYEAEIPVRFSDIDSYGHVNSTHFLDYVITARWIFAERSLKVTNEDIIKQGLGFFLVNATMGFKLPIEGVKALKVSSYVQSVTGPRLNVSYEIRSADGSSLHSSGTLLFIVMNLETKRPQELPEWAYSLFFTAN
jgi:YbgC/YbaW family acyl-CoA thioester hydrolase